MTAKMLHYVLIIDLGFLLFAFVTRKNRFRIEAVISPFDEINAFLACTRAHNGIGQGVMNHTVQIQPN